MGVKSGRDIDVGWYFTKYNDSTVISKKLCPILRSMV